MTLTPLRADSGPGDTTRVTTSPAATPSTARRGTPSPMTSCERSVTSAAKCGKSTRTRSGGSEPPLPQKTTASPAARMRVAVSADSRSLGPWRSNSSPSGRPARSAASRTAAARRRRSSCVPCEQFSRAQSTPAATSWSSTPGGSVAGPSVATIFVLRPNMGGVWHGRLQEPGPVGQRDGGGA